MRILVTGGAGFIGSCLVHTLISRKHEVGVFDCRINFINKPKYYQTALSHRKKIYRLKPEFDGEADIRDKKNIAKAFKEFKPNVVVHLAGLPMARPLTEYESEMIPINLEGTLNVLDVFEKSSHAQKMIYTSSSMAYGHFTKNPQHEDTILNPINAYGATKAAGEYFVKLSKKEWIIVRPTSVYGYTDCANRVSQILLDAAINNKSAWVVKGEALDFSYIDDVVDGFTKCIEHSSALYQTINISRGEPRSAVDFAEIVKLHFPKFTYETREPTTQQVYRGALDISRARNFLGYKPKFSIEDGIKEIVKRMKEYKWKQYAY